MNIEYLPNKLFFCTPRNPSEQVTQHIARQQAIFCMVHDIASHTHILSICIECDRLTRSTRTRIFGMMIWQLNSVQI